MHSGWEVQLNEQAEANLVSPHSQDQEAGKTHVALSQMVTALRGRAACSEGDLQLEPLRCFLH